MIPARLSLQIIAGPAEGGVLSSSKSFHLTIGRTKASSLHRDTAVSEKHALISWTGSHWCLSDMGSSNGTQVNGRKLNLTDSVELKDGDEIVFGLETKAKVILTPRKGLDDITVEQLMMAHSEAAAHEIEAKGKENAKSLLTEIQDSKKTLQQRVHLISN